MTQAIEFRDFSLGEDLRKNVSVSDANRLRELKNAYVSTGKTLKKRPGTTLAATLESGTKGLFAGKGKLNTFYSQGTLTHSNTLFKANKVPAVTSIENTFAVVKGCYFNQPPGITGVEAQFDPMPGIDPLVEPRMFHITPAGCYLIFPPAVNFRIPPELEGYLIELAPDYKTQHTTANIYGGRVFKITVEIFLYIPHSSDLPTPIATPIPGSSSLPAGNTYLVPEGWVMTFGISAGPDITSENITKVHFGAVVRGHVYAVVEYESGTVKHHYLDGANTTMITDPMCPHTKQVIPMQQKIFAVGRPKSGVVKFSATDNPRDWTSSGDAGFLPTGSHEKGAEDPTALGQSRKNLVVFHKEQTIYHRSIGMLASSGQMWTVDPDPKYHAFNQILTHDMVFLSNHGFRSIAETDAFNSNNMSEVDIGTPIDADVKNYLPVDGYTPVAVYYSYLGQFWCAIGSVVFVLTHSPLGKITAWSKYVYPWSIDDLCVLDSKLYMRSGNNVYVVDPAVYTDNGTAIDVGIQMAYVDAKRPVVQKRWIGFDAVIKGSAQVSFKYDPRDESLEGMAMTLSGDTRPGDMHPVEIISPSLSTVVRHSANEDFELSELSLYFEFGGAV